MITGFSIEDREQFLYIAEQCEDIQALLLHKADISKDLSICFPLAYIKWLSQHENNSYRKVGSRLTDLGRKLVLDAQDVYDEIISGWKFRICADLENVHEGFQCVVFDHPKLSTSSAIVRELKQNIPQLANVNFVALKQWEQQRLQEELRKK